MSTSLYMNGRFGFTPRPHHFESFISGSTSTVFPLGNWYFWSQKPSVKSPLSSLTLFVTSLAPARSRMISSARAFPTPSCLDFSAGSNLLFLTGHLESFRGGSMILTNRCWGNLSNPKRRPPAHSRPLLLRREASLPPS